MKEVYKLKSKIYKKYDARYIKISKNQMRILESLYVDGSHDKKYYDSKNKLRYSEHSGLLDFGKFKLCISITNLPLKYIIQLLCLKEIFLTYKLKTVIK